MLWVPGEGVAQDRALLADEENARADRLLLPRVRERFIFARAILRRLLAGYLHVDPAKLVFRYTAQGKPYLGDGAALCFNLSHSKDVAVIAIARRREIGIDIEATTRDVEFEGVARKVFSPNENARLARVTPELRRAAFFRIWTRKEAYVKARGEGLNYSLRSFSVSDLPGDDDALLADERQPLAHLAWRLAEIAAPAGFSAALAAPGRDWSVVRFAADRLSPARLSGPQV